MPINRRRFLKVTGSVAVAAQFPWLVPNVGGSQVDEEGVLLNDVHSGLNPTRVQRVERPHTIADLRAIIGLAKEEGRSISIGGGRHAGGGQQFATDSIHVDTRGMDGILDLDRKRGLVTVEAGIQWRPLVEGLLAMQEEDAQPWTIRQKQTGADTLCIGGAVSANVHGRGLAMKPFVNDIESLTLINADGDVVVCSRTRNPELFSLVVGGYGLFGVIATVTLRLSPRQKMQRVIEVMPVSSLIDAHRQRVAAGFIYGDFPFNVDETSATFLSEGVFSCYQPVEDDTPIPSGQMDLSSDRWLELVAMAHVDRAAAFKAAKAFYESTDGQVYWSDLHQLSTYDASYRAFVKERTGSTVPRSLVLSEMYVPRSQLEAFLGEAATILISSGVPLIYSTVRFIEPDTETFLPWAKESLACVIFNLLVEHTPEGKEQVAETFRALIDAAIGAGGRYYLTYHRFAREDQVLACYPQLPAFMEKKLQYDPDERFQSAWYRAYRDV